jgi:hypothetical protein
LKVKLTFFLTLAVLFNNCRKDGKGCWQAFDPLGYDVQGLVLCNKTKAEAEAAYPQYWFYRQKENKYCWQIQNGTNTSHAYDIPESIADKYMSVNNTLQFTKVDCGSFCICKWLEKRKSKITGEFTPARVIIETFLSPDTCSKLFIGRLIVVKETADSFITRELTDKHP